MAKQPEDKKGVKTYQAPERRGPSMSVTISTLVVLALIVLLLIWIL